MLDGEHEIRVRVASREIGENRARECVRGDVLERLAHRTAHTIRQRVNAGAASLRQRRRGQSALGEAALVEQISLSVDDTDDAQPAAELGTRGDVACQLAPDATKAEEDDIGTLGATDASTTSLVELERVVNGTLSVPG